MSRTLPLVFAFLLLPAPTAAQQVTAADYDRASSVGGMLGPLIVHEPSDPEWVGETNRFWYSRSLPDDGREWYLVDAPTAEKGPLFDHARLAAVLSAATGEAYTATTLPLGGRAGLEVEDDLSAITFELDDDDWRCTLADYVCEETEPSGPRGGPPGRFGGQDDDDDRILSPDSLWEAAVRNYNLAIRPADGGNDDWVMLSHEGSEGDAYQEGSIEWSPDSRKIMAYREKPGHPRQVHYVESSPDDQIQPKHSTRNYQKPGDVRDHPRPVLFDVESRTQVVVDDALFPNPYQLRRGRWWEDSRAFTFEYNERGHTNYRVIQVDAATGEARALVDERPGTFFNYDGTLWREDVDDGREILWRSERDGWKHLWLYDGLTGRVKNQVTRGEWVVRGVDRVDEESRQIWFRASGMNPDQDPYFIHYYRIDFDGTDLVTYTEANGDHEVSWSPDREYYVDTWSRADQAPVMELRRTSDQARLAEIERADISRAVAAGWTPPEPFVAKGRDGETDIWGMILRPMNFDPDREYPVIEYIYAGPHSSHVPKSFSTQAGRQSLAELGFIVVQIDGMGTNDRSKAFHDVAWKNLGDAGFPDRIAWHRAAARRYEYYDTTRVGIYGTSAGGQNSLGALLFHPDFYDVAVSAAGCHDNRMDKIWWNELWMSWPLGPHYAAASNVDNAHKLQGRLLLVVGEMDTNVDPASTLQVADALIEADKDFDLLFLPGAGHTSGGSYGTRKRNDFFVRHLQGVEPPAWNRITATTAEEAGIDPEFDDWLEVPLGELYPRSSGDEW